MQLDVEISPHAIVSQTEVECTYSLAAVYKQRTFRDMDFFLV